MKKYLAALVLLAAVPATASAEIADSSTTTNFTVEIVEESLGLVVSGSTNLGKISRNSLPELTFPDLRISNQGEVKGYLYAEVGGVSGIDFGDAEGDLTNVWMVSGGENIESLDQSEQLLSTAMRKLDSDGDPDGISPGETLDAFDVTFQIREKLPAGKLNLPVRWTLKPE